MPRPDPRLVLMGSRDGPQYSLPSRRVLLVTTLLDIVIFCFSCTFTYTLTLLSTFIIYFSCFITVFRLSYFLLFSFSSFSFSIHISLVRREADVSDSQVRSCTSSRDSCFLLSNPPFRIPSIFASVFLSHPAAFLSLSQPLPPSQSFLSLHISG